ncbi:kda subunit of rna polymerase ii [Stylonychia lemnae]|uniref:KDa subunit of rna polymerase ii n=1 Tax=Stylonychia lemnae TaxID=5949 RepID=A0A077ZP23_STYLE|nr:kda subunit of rna polymerase ii [Stylonychia lemnae]|eukprot:CDW71663.1 kda subunit of rna polymerase ii [Stylonychia lemnae]
MNSKTIGSNDFMSQQIDDIFEDAFVISNAEVVFLMKKQRQEKEKLASMGNIQNVNQIGEEMQKKTDLYVNKFNVFEQEDKIKTIRREMDKIKEISDRELVLMWNLTPDTYDEAVTLIPSLQDKPEDVVQSFIDLLNKSKV